jgi:hypothetical protein
MTEKQAENESQNKKPSPKPQKRFDALWWFTITVPVLWWAVLLVFALMGKVGWGIFISTGFIVQGSLYGLQSVLRMIIKPWGRGYKTGHFVGFLLVGLFWAVMGIVLIFVTRGL